MDTSKTKAGILPNDWAPIRTASEIYTNYTNKKHNGTNLVLSATQERGIVPRSEVEIDIKYDKENLSGYKKVQAGNFIISLRSFQGGIEYSNYEGLVSPAYTVLKNILPIADDYYRNYFKTTDFISRLNSATDLKQQLIEEARNCKKWLMQKFIRKKKHYTKTKIGELTEVYAGATPSTKIPEYWDGDIRWMSSGELNYKRVYDVEGRITEQGLANSGTKLLPEKCVLVGLAGQGKTRGTVAINYVPLCTNQSIAAILPSKKYVSEFLFWNLENRYTELRKLSSGDGARGGLNLDIIKGITVYLPPLDEQQNITDILSSADRKV